MSIFSLFQSDKRTPEWTHTAKGTIWRILFSEGGSIVGECRDQDKKLATFFCVNGQTGQVLWEHGTLEEPWWVGIEAIQGNIVLFHEFAKPDLPQHKKIRAFDVGSGKELWKNDDLTFWFGYKDKLYAYRDLFDGRVGYAMNVHTGEIEETYNDRLGELQTLRRLATDEQHAEDFRFPEPLNVETAEGTVSSIVRKEIRGEQVMGNIEYLKEQGYLLLNYHTQSPGSTIDAPTYENRLAIFDIERGKKIFEETLGRNLKAFVPDSFFLKLPFVYFIKDQQTLTALQLWKS